MTELNEPILDDDYPVYAGYIYVMDGHVRSWNYGQSTVAHVKLRMRIKEVRRCDLTGRRKAREAGPQPPAPPPSVFPLAVLVFFLAIGGAQARDAVHTRHPSTLSTREIIRDANGNKTGSINRAARPTDPSIIRDRSGNKVGTSEVEQGRTVIRDRSGNKVGSVGR